MKKEQEEEEKMKAKLSNLDLEIERRKKERAEQEQEDKDSQASIVLSEDPKPSSKLEEPRESQLSENDKSALRVQNWSAFLMSKAAAAETATQIDAAFLKGVISQLSSAHGEELEEKIDSVLLFDQLTACLDSQGVSRELMASASEISENILA
eukprot:CAMPEP_0170510770 /NCGR_PEP_ID=MMETSP0208-20121228/65943_1 /TAXON_ID=197538 /ORGANISM="Strombidium inclinatum, Strain S3" /LENGTH=152 /DNA_ID=CAMNT_0010794257 /DNA_START=42 /DNA_END=500 /DNA_ORIENTATION=+